MARYRNPKVTVDGVVFDRNKVLLIRRKNPPFRGKWALPGGFVEYGETVEKAIMRELLEETGLKVKPNSIIGIYSDPRRDPRWHIITIAYLCKKTGGELKGGDDALEAKYFSVHELPEMAFDHRKIIKDALSKTK